MKRFSLFQIKRDISRTFLVSLLLSVSVFGWLRIMFFDFPFSVAEEAVSLAKTIGTYWMLTLGVKVLLNLGLEIFDWMRKPAAIKTSFSTVGAAATVLLFASALISCNIPPTGIKKDFNTGMVTKYSGLIPGETDMIMNGEVIKHTDIPLGQSFTIMNKDIKGMVVKDEKVSVGCSLRIADSTGKDIFFAEDLFKDTPTFHKDSATNLKCEVNTGQPMDWNKKYAVTVIFWDKYGEGKIENTTQISAIRIP